MVGTALLFTVLSSYVPCVCVHACVSIQGTWASGVYLNSGRYNRIPKMHLGWVFRDSWEAIILSSIWSDWQEATRCLHYGTKITNTEGTNASFICDFNLKPTYDYKTPLVENSKAEGY